MKMTEEDAVRRIEKLKSYIGLVREAWKHATGAMELFPSPDLAAFRDLLAQLERYASLELHDLAFPPPPEKTP